MIKTVSLREEAESRICAATYGAIAGADCECIDGVLVLRGTVRSFYSKQLAQESVGRLPGVLDVVNEIEVISAT